jgi:hypothetical protein
MDAKPGSGNGGLPETGSLEGVKHSILCENYIKSEDAQENLIPDKFDSSEQRILQLCVQQTINGLNIVWKASNNLMMVIQMEKNL